MAHKALLTGINNYKYISDLRGCINDVRDVQKLLAEEFGFSSANIRVLTDEQVTKERVLKEWKWLLAGAKRGDQLVFHYSGHGSQIADKDGDEDDGVDELICLYDMDFDDPQTYLLDDELREMTSRVPDGVNLTIIFDSCHSGTATRMLLAPNASRDAGAPAKGPLMDVEATLTRMESRTGSRSLSPGGLNMREAVKNVLSPQDSEQMRNTVLVRYVAPPPHVLAAVERNGVRSSFQVGMRDAAKMNHILLAGSKDSQTSADAYIANNYHGAFSHHLCQVVRGANGDLEYSTMMRQVRSALSGAGFSQVPQLEPADTHGPVFRGKQKGNGPEKGVPGGGGPQSLTGMDEVVGLLREIKDLLQQPAAGRPAVRASAGRGLVYVHGICHHEAGFSDGWWDAMAPHLSPGVRAELGTNRHEVLWSDLVDPDRNARAAQSSRAEDRERQELRTAIRAVLQDRARRESLPLQKEINAPVPLAARDRAFLGIPGLDCVDDFLKYLLDDDIRAAVQKRFLDQALPLLQSGQKIEVISHSWGTVVAYESLRRLDSQSLSGRVHAFFTVGSALSIGMVQDRLRPDDGRRPAIVDRWINLDARGDIVGGPLADASFQVDAEYLNLQPIGCGTFLGQVSPACAHSSYFDAENTPVNAEIFAGQIED